MDDNLLDEEDDFLTNKHAVCADHALYYANDLRAYWGFLYEVFIDLEEYCEESEYLHTFYAFAVKYRDDSGYQSGLRFEEADLQDYVIPVISQVSILKPNPFSCRIIQDLLDTSERLFWSRSVCDRQVEQRQQFEFGLIMDRFWHSLESLKVHLLANETPRSELGHTHTPRSEVRLASDDRDKFIYENVCDPAQSLATIRLEVEKNKDWRTIETEDGIRKAADRYATRKKKPKPPSRKNRSN